MAYTAEPSSVAAGFPAPCWLWRFDSATLGTVRVEQQTTPTGDLCHYNISDLSDSTAKTLLGLHAKPPHVTGSRSWLTAQIPRPPFGGLGLFCLVRALSAVYAARRISPSVAAQSSSTAIAFWTQHQGFAEIWAPL